MRVLNPGDWASQSLQLRFDDPDEYDKFRAGLAVNHLKVGEVARVNGNTSTMLYLLIEGHQTLVYLVNGNPKKVPEEHREWEKPLEA